MEKKKEGMIIIAVMFLFAFSLNGNLWFLTQNIENLNQIQTSDDSYEFNNYFFNSILIEEGNYTNLECYDDDYFKIRIKSDYTLQVEITFENSLGNLDLELYDSVETLLNSSTSVVNDGESLSYNFSSGNYCTIRVFYVDNSNVYNLSVSYSIIPGQKSIEVIDPQEGVTWNEGTTYDITWTSSGSVGDVEILLESVDPNAVGRYLDFGDPNDGSYSWTVPDDLVSRDDYYIVIQEEADNSVANKSDLFSINNPSIPYSYINILTPNASTIWQNGSACEITWDYTSYPDAVDISLYESTSINPISTIAEDIDNDGSYTWIIPDSLETDNNYYIHVRHNASLQVRDNSDYFWIVNTDPSDKILIVNTPEADEEWIAGNPHEISWFSSGNIENVSIQYQLSGSSSVTINSSTENDGSYMWTIPTSIESGMEYIIRITEYGGSESAISEEFTINNPNSGKLYVNIPNLSSQWHNGTSYNITWKTLGIIDKVNISLYNEYGFVYIIASNVDNYNNYSWMIPNNLTGGLGYYINISYSSDSTIYSVSDSFHLICDGIPPSSINFLEPEISANWIVTNSYNITWEWTGVFSNVNIELWEIGTGFIQTIAEDAENNGSYSWQVPLSPFLPAGDEYYFAIYNPENNVPFDTSAVFSIINDHIITITNPTASVDWEIGSEYEITWSSTGSITNVGIKLYYFGVPVLTISSNTANDGSFMWTIPGSVTPHDDDYYRIEIYEVGLEYFINDDSDGFSILSTLPDSITVSSPNSSTQWAQGTAQTITWTSTGSITNVDILLEHEGITATIVSSTTNDGSYIWNIPDSLVVDNDYQIIIRDSSTPSLNDTSEAFSIIQQSGTTDTPPGGIPGYDTVILLIITTGSIMGIILVIRRKYSNKK